MAENYNVASDGTIFEIKPDGSINKLGRVTYDGKLESFTSQKSVDDTNSVRLSTILAWLLGVILAIVGMVCINQTEEIASREREITNLNSQIEELHDMVNSLNMKIQKVQYENNYY